MTNYPIDDALADAENTFVIDLINSSNGTPYPNAAICKTNTLAQILNEYAADLGINVKDHKITFVNKRTHDSVSDVNATAGDLNLTDGDVLLISDTGYNA